MGIQPTGSVRIRHHTGRGNQRRAGARDRVVGQRVDSRGTFDP